MNIRDIENAENFMEEYDEIHQKLEDLLCDLTDKNLQKEVNELLSVLEEDYAEERKNAEDIVREAENLDLEYQNMEFERSRL